MAVAGSLTYKTELDNKDFDSSFEKLKGTVSGGAKVMAGILATVSAATIAIGSAAINAYADYEQLVGGAQLMFADAYDFIADKAANAYSTVQLSQNEYLQQVNGLATGLKTALGGDAQAAAELADKVVTAEADIIAATGASQDAVQAAFNGIMKSNYTMLDNLQLGIKPTKEGMQEVIDKVNEWNAANGKATSYQIDNLADCQSALVDYIEMQGMAGYAANEAADTIQGTLSSLVGAWKNLLTGMASDNADFEKLISNFVDSLVNFAKQLIPRIKNVLSGLSELILGFAKDLVPMIIDALPELIEMLVTTIVEASVDIVQAVVDVLPAIVEALAEQIPIIVEAGMNILVALIEGIASAIPTLIEMLPTIIVSIVNTILANLPAIITAGLQILVALIEGLVQAIPQLIDMLPTIIETIVNVLLDPNMIAMLIEAAIRIMVALAVGMIQGIPKLISMIPQIISSIVNAFKNMDWGELGRNILSGIMNGFSAAGNIVWDAIKSVGNSMLDGIKSFFGIASPAKRMKPYGKFITQGFAMGYEDGEDDLLDSVDKVNENMIKEMNKSMNLETGNITGKAFIDSNFSSMKVINVELQNSPIEMDGRKVAQYTAPYISKEIKLQGV